MAVAVLQRRLQAVAGARGGLGVLALGDGLDLLVGEVLETMARRRLASHIRSGSEERGKERLTVYAVRCAMPPTERTERRFGTMPSQHCCTASSETSIVPVRDVLPREERARLFREHCCFRSSAITLSSAPAQRRAPGLAHDAGRLCAALWPTLIRTKERTAVAAVAVHWTLQTLFEPPPGSLTEAAAFNAGNIFVIFVTGTRAARLRP